MGNYNSEYQDYYNSMIKRNRKSYGISGASLGSSIFNKNRIMKRIIQELLGGVLLFSSIIVYKANMLPLPQSKEVYSYSKQIVHKNYDYEKIISELKLVQTMKPEELESSVNEWLEGMKKEVLKKI